MQPQRFLRALALASLALAAPALAQTEIKFGHVGEPGSRFAADYSPGTTSLHRELV